MSDYARFEKFEKLSIDEKRMVFHVFFPIGIVMMYNDPKLLYPVVLNKDAEAFDKTLSISYVQKAHNSGVYAMNFGKNYNSQTKSHRKTSKKKTHVRLPSIMRLKSGVAGRTEERVVPRKGCTVNGPSILNMPTGYYGLGNAIAVGLLPILRNIK